MSDNDVLKLESQLCFPLYVTSKEIVRRYTPFLEEIGLTYTQYIVMMVLWEREGLSVKELGRHVYLDSGTLTPLLKKMENADLVQRSRDPKDERVVIVSLTEKGKDLREKAKAIPTKMAECLKIEPEDAKLLYDLLYKVMGNFEK